MFWGQEWQKHVGGDSGPWDQALPSADWRERLGGRSQVLLLLIQRRLGIAWGGELSLARKARRQCQRTIVWVYFIYKQASVSANLQSSTQKSLTSVSQQRRQLLCFCLSGRNWSLAFPNRPALMPIHWVGHRTAGHSSAPLRWLRNVTENLPNCYQFADMQMTYVWVVSSIRGLRWGFHYAPMTSSLLGGNVHTGRKTHVGTRELLLSRACTPRWGWRQRAKRHRRQGQVRHATSARNLNLRVGTSHVAKDYAFWVLSLTVTRIG